MDTLTMPFDWAAGILQVHAVLPLLYALDLMQWEDAGYGWSRFAVYGAVQVAVTYAVCVPLERIWPIERWSDRRGVAVDVLYTLIARVGLLPLVTFVLFYALQTRLNGFLTDHGYVPPTLERWIPGLLGQPTLTFLLYVVILDFADYWRHRLSHIFDWWYALHALHHAQTQMTFWSDDRNHVLDELMSFGWFIGVGLLIGVPPLQFPLLVLLLKFLESFSHANTRVRFGWLGERLLISPRFHRAHHGLLAAGQRSCNFGAVLPWWDMLFRTADFSSDFVPTGDPTAEPALVRGGWTAQQAAGLRRLLRIPPQQADPAAGGPA
jgi:sterol desaturase/sphingolipid hydroxylase (fatty acid hydroxylase superfamily)